MTEQVQKTLQKQLEELKESGLYKDERIIETPQNAEIEVPEGKVINFCANNYLGLANHPDIKQAAQDGIDEFGYGLSSVRFICGTQTIHKKLERTISDYLGFDDTILYTSCFDANTGFFESFLTEEDVIISDELNHASIIDGVRMCKSDKEIYAHSDMDELEEILQQSMDHRFRLIATDGVFSMDGDYARLDEICDLADQYDALVFVDDSHATGFVGETGKGTPEKFGVMDQIDILTSTLGKALGGATGGFAAARQEIVDILRQQSRPYLFSNSIPPMIASAGIEAIRLLDESDDLRQQLHQNTEKFRTEMEALGFSLKPGDHPIVPIMLGEAQLATDMSNDLLEEGIYVIGFSYPVVPKGEARIRVQMSAAHTEEQIDRAVRAFEKVGKQLDVI